MTKRDFYFDNAKFILIFFVVFGHLLQSFIEDHQAIYTVYKVIYSFHMPAFILLSGYFAKGFYEKGYFKKITKKLILPYLIFQLIYSVFYYLLYNKSSLTVDPLNPHWSLWFLISLFFWNIMLLGFAKFKPVTSITIAVLIALAVGYVDWISNYLSLSRTFVFFPFFLIGYLLNKQLIFSLFNPKIRIMAAIAFISVFTWFYMNPDISYQWLLGSKPYANMDTSHIASVFTRTGFFLLSFIMVLGFLAFVPKRQYFFTNLGKNTLYVYLLHGFIVRLFRESTLQNFFQEPENFLLLAIISLLLTLLLSSSITTAITQPIIELNTSRLKMLIARLQGILQFFRKKMLS